MFVICFVNVASVMVVIVLPKPLCLLARGLISCIFCKINSNRHSNYWPDHLLIGLLTFSFPTSTGGLPQLRRALSILRVVRICEAGSREHGVWALSCCLVSKGIPKVQAVKREVQVAVFYVSSVFCLLTLVLNNELAFLFEKFVRYAPGSGCENRTLILNF